LKAACVSLFVAQLPSPYREAVTLVELEGLTAREAAEMVGVSISGMKSRVAVTPVARSRGIASILCERVLSGGSPPGLLATGRRPPPTTSATSLAAWRCTSRARRRSTRSHTSCEIHVVPMVSTKLACFHA
jgi:hypothetical protein